MPVLRGSAHLRLREMGAPEHAFRSLDADEPASIRARVGLADALAWQRRFDDAVAQLEASTAADPALGRTSHAVVAPSPWWPHTAVFIGHGRG